MDAPKQSPQTSKKLTQYKHIVLANKKLVQKLVELSGVKEDLVKSFITFTKCLIKPGLNYIDRQIFTVVMFKYFEISDTVFVRKIYDKISKLNPDRLFSVEDFARVLCIYFTGRLDLKIDFVFSLYDLNDDGAISMSEMVGLLKGCKCVTDTDDADRDDTVADLTMMASDLLGITNEEPCTQEMFRAKAKENYLILSLLGHSLPERDVANRFKAKLVGKSGLELNEMFGNIRHELLNELQDKDQKKYYPITLDLN